MGCVMAEKKLVVVREWESDTFHAKVLELDSKNSQATSIRYWLRDNP